jgi:hypothetical protein
VERVAKALSRALYRPRRKERAKNLDLVVEVNMASRAKHRWSALQSAFTASKFSATVGDVLRILKGPFPRGVSLELRFVRELFLAKV